MHYQLVCVLKISMRNLNEWHYRLGAILEQERFYTSKTLASDIGSSVPLRMGCDMPEHC